MTTTRSITLVAALAALVTASGCGSNTCNDATPPVKAVPTACTAVVGQALTVPVNTCPKCDQGSPTCEVRFAGGGEFFLEPVSEVCDPNSSCPIPALDSCAALATGCTLTAAMTAALTPGAYRLNIVTETGAVTEPLTVVAASGEIPGCTGSVRP